MDWLAAVCIGPSGRSVKLALCSMPAVKVPRVEDRLARPGTICHNAMNVVHLPRALLIVQWPTSYSDVTRGVSVHLHKV